MDEGSTTGGGERRDASTHSCGETTRRYFEKKSSLLCWREHRHYHPHTHAHTHTHHHPPPLGHALSGHGHGTPPRNKHHATQKEGCCCYKRECVCVWVCPQERRVVVGRMMAVVVVVGERVVGCCPPYLCNAAVWHFFFMRIMGGGGVVGVDPTGSSPTVLSSLFLYTLFVVVAFGSPSALLFFSLPDSHSRTRSFSVAPLPLKCPTSAIGCVCVRACV